jgi:nitrite reductase/ring-hydroxylating ferredoxin subunit
VVTPGGSVRARDVIVAAHVPVSNRLLLHTKIAAYRSYAIAMEVPNELDGLFWDTEDPYHYVRTERIDGHVFLVVGGEDHKTGQETDTEEPYRRLEAYARQRFGVLRPIAHRWSGQIVEPVDGLPFIGRNSFSSSVYVATGFSGNGMTFGTLAGMILSDLVLGLTNRYADLYDATRLPPLASMPTYVRENADFIRYLASDRIGRGDAGVDTTATLAPGQGRIMVVEGERVAAYRDARGVVHLLSPVCPHLFCDVRWNAAESSWDCPCHGSRFSGEGKLLNGPAVSDLAPRTGPR